MKKSKMKLRGTKDIFISVSKEERIIWSMTDEEWALLTPYWCGDIAFNDLPPSVKKYVKFKNMKSPVVDIVTKNSIKSM